MLPSSLRSFAGSLPPRTMLALLAAAWLTTVRDSGLESKALAADKKKDDAVEEMMEKVHEGKRSPWKQAQAAAASNPPDWNVLANQLGRLEQMSALLKGSKVSDIADSSDGYVNAVTALSAKTKAKDEAGVRKALESLKQSCGDCHYKGGIGGKLD